jgi:hypothetical protein
MDNTNLSYPQPSVQSYAEKKQSGVYEMSQAKRDAVIKGMTLCYSCLNNSGKSEFDFEVSVNFMIDHLRPYGLSEIEEAFLYWASSQEHLPKPVNISNRILECRKIKRASSPDKFLAWNEFHGDWNQYKEHLALHGRLSPNISLKT